MPEDERNEQGKRPVVWTPEDASNFLTAAIKESQKPLAEALARPSVPLSAFLVALLVVALLCGAAVAFFLKERAWYRQRIDNLQTKTQSLQDKAADETARASRLEGAADQIDRLHAREESLAQQASEYRARIDELKKQADAMRRASTGRLEEVARARNQIRLMQEQIDGIEQEKSALSRQVTSARKLIRALQEETLGRPLETDDAFAPEQKPAETDDAKTDQSRDPWWLRSGEEFEVIEPPAKAPAGDTADEDVAEDAPKTDPTEPAEETVPDEIEPLPTTPEDKPESGIPGDEADAAPDADETPTAEDGEDDGDAESPATPPAPLGGTVDI